MGRKPSRVSTSVPGAKQRPGGGSASSPARGPASAAVSVWAAESAIAVPNAVSSPTDASMLRPATLSSVDADVSAAVPRAMSIARAPQSRRAHRSDGLGDRLSGSHRVAERLKQ